MEQPCNLGVANAPKQASERTVALQLKVSNITERSAGMQPITSAQPHARRERDWSDEPPSQETIDLAVVILQLTTLA
jgi:hypothetical protein